MRAAKLFDWTRVALVAALVTFGALMVASASAQADVTAVSGSAFGYQLKVSLFGGGVNTRGFGQVACTNPPTNNAPPGCAPTPASSSSPSVLLPPAGGNVSQTDADGTLGGVGPATFFSSGQLMVASQGTIGPSGSVTSSTSIATVNASAQEVFTASKVASTCTASQTVSGSTTITGGTLQVDSGDTTTGDVHPPVTMAVPVNPAPNTTFTGHVHAGAQQDNFRYVFNEQTVNPDGSITVNAAHETLLGPTAVGDLFIGQSKCGLTGMQTPPPPPGTGGTTTGSAAASSATPTTQPDIVAPGVSGYALTNSTFAVGGATTPLFGVAAAKKHKQGTTFRYTLSEAGSVKIVITQRRPGRRKNKKCVRPTSQLVKAKKCTRVITLGTLTRVSHLGTNTAAFSGRIGTKTLAPGSYQATLTATDSANNASRGQSNTFRIVKR